MVNWGPKQVMALKEGRLVTAEALQVTDLAQSSTVGKTQYQGVFGATGTRYTQAQSYARDRPGNGY